MSLLDSPKELRLIFEQALLPAVFEAMTEQVTMPLVMAMQDIIHALHEEGRIDVGGLAAKLQKSAASCGQNETPAALLNVMADFCAALVAGEAPECDAQKKLRSVLKLVWTRPEVDE